MALAARAIDACTNPNCKAKKRSTHTTVNCYWPGGGKEGQFPPNFRQRAKANIANSNVLETKHFVLSTWARALHEDVNIEADDEAVDEIIIKDGDENVDEIIIEDYDESIVKADISPKALASTGFRSFGQGKVLTFMDSGVSNTMFISQDDFVEYKTIASHTGDSAKAMDGGFSIVGEGKVVQRYLVEGKEKKITYTHTLHTPTLNANLISISAFDKAGLNTTFGSGCGVIRKRDGSVVLTRQGEKGMYIVDVLGGQKPNLPDRPLAMSSLSQPTTLEQWHR